MKTLKQILVILTTIIILLITSNGEVNASLQSNPNTHYKNVDIVGTWIRKFREMETTGETMGLSEILNEDLTASSESNNIDVHMIRSTEYGATAILSVSGYGNPISDKLITTTTGNDTGVMIKTGGGWEWVAGTIEGSRLTTYNKRYYDIYTYVQESARVGDALGNATTSNPGCYDWHSAAHLINYVRFMEGGYLARGGEGLFSTYNTTNTDFYKFTYDSRGVVVCGYGI